MYIDALWAYYKDGKPIASDEDFEKLKMELNWQGSGFPTLHREEVEFVEVPIFILPASVSWVSCISSHE